MNRQSFHPLLLALAAVVLLPVPGVLGAALASSDATLLWYTAPATNWNEAVPLGNGQLGAMVFGGVQQERVLCNEISLWSGWPETENDRPGAFAALEKVRQLLREGKRKEAGDLAVSGFLSSKGYGKPDFGAHQAFCDVLVDFDGLPAQVENYRRELDLDTATARVSFAAGETRFEREFFCSYPDQVSVMRFTSSHKRKLNLQLGLKTLHKNSKVEIKGNELVLDGQVDTQSPAHEGMKFQARLIVRVEGGTVRGDAARIRVTDADAVTVLFVGATNYKLEYPAYRGEAPDGKNARTLRALAGKSFAQLRAAHVADYRSLFRRVSLTLDEPTRGPLPTDVRLQRYRKAPDDRALEILLFNFGRYLLIASSRPGGLPANLQGLWNNSLTPPWNCDYHLNINLQMNYWPAGPANLDECAEPLMRWLQDLQTPGAKTAKIHYNSRGWVVHLVANVWGYTAPGSARGIHMLETESAAFICQNVWDYFAFTQDRDWLRRTGWPLLKGAAEFWVDNLQATPDGHLTVSPSYSPEHGPLAIGAYWPIMIVHDLFGHCLEAGAILQTDTEFCGKLQQLRARLQPLQVGQFGQLCEWADADLEAGVQTDRHRHIAHLYAVYPGTQITPDTTPELAKAARQSMEYRGDGGTGWSTAWKMNVWARLRDGDRAWKLLSQHIARDTLPNLWDTCPPFQIDGNFGYTAGVCELLLQSHGREAEISDAKFEIELLPALPKAWPTGSVKGLRARGGFTVDIAWSAGKVTDYRVASPEPREVKVRINGETKIIKSVKR